MDLHPSFDYSKFSYNELLLGHTVCHNLFVLRKDKKTVDLIKSCHALVVKELEKHDFSHGYVDKLDKL